MRHGIFPEILKHHVYIWIVILMLLLDVVDDTAHV